MGESRPESILWRHLGDLPYFRAMVRAVEDSFYQDLYLPGPVLDMGCGDGHFASVAFRSPLDVGIDPWWSPLLEAHNRKTYRMVVQADGAKTPFPTAAFGSAISNSVLEHIPHVDQVVNEIARLVRPGGRFVFCVPNHRFPQLLFGSKIFRSIKLSGLAENYSAFFNRISRHVHCDDLNVWKSRLGDAGFEIEKHWDYFPADALYRMETGHAFGLPSLISKKITGKWILSKSRVNLWIPYLLTRKVYENPWSDEGVYSFYITRRLG